MVRAFPVLLLLVGVVVPTAAGAVTTQSTHATASTHVASTWDAPDTGVRILDRRAVRADVTVDRQLVPTNNPVCELHTTTLTIVWTALNGHRLTSVVDNYDDYSLSFTALNTATFSMTPTGQVLDEQSPVLSHWVRKDTHRPDPRLCPRDTRSVNHVEIWVDGPPRHHQPNSLVQPPSKDHLAAGWTWFDDIDVLRPARVAVTTNVFHEVDDLDGPCEVHVTELDLFFTAVGANRIIAIGERSPGSATHYQRGDDTSFVRGVVGQHYFLDGTLKHSSRCPHDTVSQNRIEIYTEALGHH
jgi:hypothetical protein